jgi:uncharacterized membrane protein YgaE (UPF0421/DUF939 family)
LLQKQLNDLGRQVQALLKEIARRQDPTLPSDEELEADESNAPAENIDEVITNHLVLFRNIKALQAQNQKLLGIVREMGAKMEAEEREYREALEKEQSEAVREAHEAVPTMLKCRLSSRIATRSKYSSRGQSVVMPERIRIAKRMGQLWSRTLLGSLRRYSSSLMYIGQRLVLTLCACMKTLSLRNAKSPDSTLS